MLKYPKLSSQQGDILIFALVFVGIFLVLVGGLLGVVNMDRKYTLQREAQVKSLQITEAGIDYYRWHLAHDLDDYQDGTGGPGPYIHNYSDPLGGIVGKFSLEITPPDEGSTIVTIQSTGWLDDKSQLKKVIEAKYGIFSLAQYSLLTNSDAWITENEVISGEMHSNGGIRQDGTNDSLLTSAKETYICKPEHGCADEEKPGIWGAGSDSGLWNFPVPPVDFDSITVDLSQIKTEAQAAGLYFAARNKGYHVEFLATGTFNLYEVTKLESKLGQLDDDDFDGFKQEAEEIKNETLINNFPIPSNGLIFIEDNVWLEGTINGRVTLVSANFPDNPNTNTSIIINGNINYLARDGNHVLGLIAQKNIKIPRHAPSVLTIDGVLLAQKGRCFRNYYDSPLLKNNLQVYGGIITNKSWAWNWLSGSSVVDGYESTLFVYDNNLILAPPPFFPTTGVYSIISWEEVE